MVRPLGDPGVNYSTVIGGNAAEEIAKLKRRPGGACLGRSCER